MRLGRLVRLGRCCKARGSGPAQERPIFQRRSCAEISQWSARPWHGSKHASTISRAAQVTRLGKHMHILCTSQCRSHLCAERCSVQADAPALPKPKQKAFFCSICGAALTQQIPPTEHVWREVCTNPDCGRVAYRNPVMVSHVHVTGLKHQACKQACTMCSCMAPASCAHTWYQLSCLVPYSCCTNLC